MDKRFHVIAEKINLVRNPWMNKRPFILHEYLRELNELPEEQVINKTLNLQGL